MRDYFPVTETQCKCGCGLDWTDDWRATMNMVRHDCGFPLLCSSGARCEAHDKAEGGAGVHPTGNAGDYLVSGIKARILLNVAVKYDIMGIGVRQHGPHNKRIIHLDNTTGPLRPRLWSY